MFPMNVHCAFKYIGCSVRLPEKDMPVHIAESASAHLMLQTTSYKAVGDPVENKIIINAYIKGSTNSSFNEYLQNYTSAHLWLQSNLYCWDLMHIRGTAPVGFLPPPPILHPL